jgi:hypothetical protein
MPNFEFCYLDGDGSLACSFTAVCASETQAKVLAHAMKLRDYKKFEVWRDRTLVYQRPLLFESGQTLQ